MWGQHSLPHFDEASAADGPQSVAGHTSLTTVKNFQFTKLAGQKNNEAEPSITLDWPVQTAAQKESAKKWSNDTEISTKLKVMTLGRMRIASCRQPISSSPRNDFRANLLPTIIRKNLWKRKGLYSILKRVPL